MHKILGFYGLVVGTNLAQERAPVVLKALLEQNHKENDLDPNDKGLVEENQAVPELNKYFYIHRAQKESVASTKKTQMDLSADNLKIANLKNALENTAPPSIKVENPEYQELMRRKAVLATGNGYDAERARMVSASRLPSQALNNAWPDRRERPPSGRSARLKIVS